MFALMKTAQQICETWRAEDTRSAQEQRAAADAEIKRLETVAAEHFAECPECGEIFDRRSLDEVLFHTDHKTRPDIQYSGSEKLD
jgi:hypothetical protein